MVVTILYLVRIVQTCCSLNWQGVLITNIMECVYITCHKEIFKKFLRSSSTSLSVCVFHPQFVYPPDKALSRVIFQPLSYCAERFHKELLSSGTKFNYNIRLCCNNLRFIFISKCWTTLCSHHLTQNLYVPFFTHNYWNSPVN